MMRIGLVILMAAAYAVADEKLTLTFHDGKKKSLTLTSFDKQGLDAVYGKKKIRILYGQLRPESAFRARKALTSYDDGAARLDLAEFAVTLRLYPQALAELEIAQALGGINEADFEKREKEIKKLEVDFLCKRIDSLLDTGKDPHVCLAAVKRLKERYPDHENNVRYEPHIERLVGLIAKQLQEQQDAQAKVKQDKELAGVRKALDKAVRRKNKALEKAEQLFAESKPAIDKRQVSRVKKKLVEPMGAEKYYKKARSYLRLIARKIDPKFRLTKRAELQKEYEAIDRKLVECYVGVARILLTQRNYKGAVKYVQKILYYDPIHEEALDMVEEIKKNRITFKASDITNARPRVTGG